MPTTRPPAASQSESATPPPDWLLAHMPHNPHAPHIAYRTRCSLLKDPSLLQKALSLPKGSRLKITGKDLTPVEVLLLLKIDRRERQYYASAIYCPRGMFLRGSERFVFLDDAVLKEAGVPRDVVPRLQRDRREISEAGWRQRCLEDRAILEGTWYGDGRYARRSVTGGVSDEETPPAWIAKEMGWSRRTVSAVPASSVEKKEVKSIKVAQKVICKKESKAKIHVSTVTTRKRNDRNRKSSPIAPSSFDQQPSSPSTSSTSSSTNATPELLDQHFPSSLSITTRASLRSSENPSINTMSSHEASPTPEPTPTPSGGPSKSKRNKKWEATMLDIEHQSEDKSNDEAIDIKHKLEDENDDESTDSELSSPLYTPSTTDEASPPPAPTSDFKSIRRMNRKWEAMMLDTEYESEEEDEAQDQDKENIESNASQAIPHHFPIPTPSPRDLVTPLSQFPVRWTIRLLANGTAASEAIAYSPAKNITVSSSQYTLADVRKAIMAEFGFANDRFESETGIRVLRLKVLDREGRWSGRDVTEGNFEGEIRPLLDEAGMRNFYGQTMYLEFGILGNGVGSLA